MGKKKRLMGYDEALGLALSAMRPLDGETTRLSRSLNRIVFEDIHAGVDSPSSDASMKDGYALISSEAKDASPEQEVRLKLAGMSAAGEDSGLNVVPGTVVRVLTGARIPTGADAVLSEEFAECEDDILSIFNTAEPGRNILARGTDVSKGAVVARKGARLSPGLIGLLAAAGVSQVPVYRRPEIALLATGDELVVPGLPLSEGKIYASNIEMLRAWCEKLGFNFSVSVLGDDQDRIAETIRQMLSNHHAIITSGGAWTGDRDLMARTLDVLGWKKVFHRIRIGPGKAVGLGLLENVPVFLLPGGPPSNLTGFLQIALPAILKMAGSTEKVLPQVAARLEREVICRNEQWTEFVYGRLGNRDGIMVFSPLDMDSRLKSMAEATAVITIPEGIKHLAADAKVTVQVLTY